MSFRIVRVPLSDDGPAGPADGDVVLFESASGRFLDADNSPGHPSVNSSRVARADDRWQLNQLDNGYWIIQNEALGLYLDADNGAQDWDVDLGPADNRGLVWEIMPVDGGYYVLRNVAFDRYLNHTPANVNTTDVPTVDVHWNILPADVADVPAPPAVEGMVFTESSQDFQSTFDAIFNTIEANPNLGIAGVVDHQANAERVGLTQDPNLSLIHI